MTFNRSVVLTDNAKRDFREILRYTRRKWGEQQRDTYEARLVAVMERVASFPLLGAARDDLGEGVRVQAAENHMIVYRLEDDKVEILRLLHQRMETPLHLED
jgi:toxin ParE1/3/4